MANTDNAQTPLDQLRSLRYTIGAKDRVLFYLLTATIRRMIPHCDTEIMQDALRQADEALRDEQALHGVPSSQMNSN